MKILTHDGTFHTDEVFAIAFIKKFINSNVEITRTRNFDLINSYKNDRDCFVIDVGAEYDEKNRNFDHHQRDFNTRWNDGVLLSSCGLVWKYLRKKGYLKKYSDEFLTHIEEDLIKKIDLHDNGEKKWLLCNMVSMCNREENTIEDFNKSLDVATIYIENVFYNEDLNHKKYQEFKTDLENYEKSENKLIFFSSNPIKDKKVLNSLSNETEALLLVFPQTDENNAKKWYIKSINKYNEEGNKLNALAPNEWCGLAGEDLENRSGFKGFLFVHRTGFLSGANNIKVAKKVSQIIIDNYLQIK